MFESLSNKNKNPFAQQLKGKISRFYLPKKRLRIPERITGYLEKQICNMSLIKLEIFQPHVGKW